MDGEAIFARLQTISAVTALVGTRVYPQYTKEVDKTYPLIVYKVENVHQLQSFSGPTGFFQCDLRLAAIGLTPDDAEMVANALLVLDGDSSQWGTHIYQQGSFLAEDGISENTVTDQDSEEILYFLKEVVLNCNFNFTQPTT